VKLPMQQHETQGEALGGYDMQQLLAEHQMGLVGELLDELTYFR
jgi:hypothetical protein